MYRSGFLFGAAAILLNGPVACSLSDLVGQSEVPAGTSDPAVVTSEAGALGLYYGSVQKLADAVSEYVVKSGLLGDELRPGQFGSQVGDADNESAIDSRYLPGVGQTTLLASYQGVGDKLFSALQKTRAATRQARGALEAYAPLAPKALIGHLYAMEGYSEVLLADLYCSGIPLSTLNFDGNYTLKPGSTTEDVYRHAIALFDSALALSADSARIQNSARIGKARALIALGEYNTIPDIVTGIAPSYTDSLIYSAALPNEFQRSGVNFNGRLRFTVSDGEGIEDPVGIRYASLGDPRVLVRSLVSIGGGIMYYFALKYDSVGRTPITVASGIEAQLMRAEAELHTGGPWLATLNTLRTTCIDATSCPTPAPAGTGGVAGLSPKSDPGNLRDRQALLFEERALWLFLTGHRQGDMRRLIRNYGWQESELYATGAYYMSNAAGVYGESVDLPVPEAERLSNPLYRGCFSRGA